MPHIETRVPRGLSGLPYRFLTATTVIRKSYRRTRCARRSVVQTMYGPARIEAAPTRDRIGYGLSSGTGESHMTVTGPSFTKCTRMEA